jgi:hypothetical protein
LAVPVIIPRLVHVGEGDVPVIVDACVKRMSCELCTQQFLADPRKQKQCSIIRSP